MINFKFGQVQGYFYLVSQKTLSISRLKNLENQEK